MIYMDARTWHEQIMIGKTDHRMTYWQIREAVKFIFQRYLGSDLLHNTEMRLHLWRVQIHNILFYNVMAI